MSTWSTSSSFSTKYVPPTHRNKPLTKSLDSNSNSNTNKFNSKKEKTIELTNELIEESFPLIGNTTINRTAAAAAAIPIISFASTIKKTDTNNNNGKNSKNGKNKNHKNKKSKLFLTILDKEREEREREEREENDDNNKEEEEKEKDKVRPGWVHIRKHNGEIQYKYGKERLNWYLEKAFIRETFKHERLILKYKIAREQWDRDRENDYLGDLSPYYNEPTIKEKLDSVSRRKRYINFSGQKPAGGIDYAYDDYNDDFDDDINSNSNSDSDEVDSDNSGNNMTNNNLEKVEEPKKIIPELLTK